MTKPIIITSSVYTQLHQNTPLDRVKRIWCLSPMRAAKVQASLRIRADSPEPPLLAHRSSESRGTFRQKARSLAPLNGWACAVKICHDGMLEDTNSLDGAPTDYSQLVLSYKVQCIAKSLCQFCFGTFIFWALGLCPRPPLPNHAICIFCVEHTYPYNGKIFCLGKGGTHLYKNFSISLYVVIAEQNIMNKNLIKVISLSLHER